jgi:hypothetical protein
LSFDLLKKKLVGEIKLGVVRNGNYKFCT